MASGGLRIAGKPHRSKMEHPLLQAAAAKAPAPAPAAAPAPAPAADTKVFDKGEKIEALYKGKKNWYAGVVDRYNEDAGTYDVTYDDGEVEKGVKQENIARAPGDSELEVGARIEAKYKGKRKYYPGKVAARSGDTYDIDYDDGEKESGVARNLIREA